MAIRVWPILKVDRKIFESHFKIIVIQIQIQGLNQVRLTEGFGKKKPGHPYQVVFVIVSYIKFLGMLPNYSVRISLDKMEQGSPNQRFR